MNDTETPYLAHLVKYDTPSEVEYDAEENSITNHDDLETTDVVRCFSRDSCVPAHNPVTPDDGLWREEFAEMDPGDEVEL